MLTFMKMDLAKHLSIRDGIFIRKVLMNGLLVLSAIPTNQKTELL